MAKYSEIEYYGNPPEAEKSPAPLPNDYQVPNQADKRGCSPLGCLPQSCLSFPGCIFTFIFGMIGSACLLGCLALAGLGGVFALLLSNEVYEEQTLSYSLEPSQTGGLILPTNLSPTVTITSDGVQSDTITIYYKLSAYGFSKGAARDNLAAAQLTINQASDGGVMIDFSGNSGILTFYDLILNISAPPELESVLIEKFSAVTVQGVTADFLIRDEFGGNILLSDVNGSFDLLTGSVGKIDFSGRLANDSVNRMETRQGAITIDLGRPANADYSAQTGDLAKVDCPDQPISLNLNRCEGQLGDATARLEVVSANGEIRITAQ